MGRGNALYTAGGDGQQNGCVAVQCPTAAFRVSGILHIRTLLTERRYFPQLDSLNYIHEVYSCNLPQLHCLGTAR